MVDDKRLVSVKSTKSPARAAVTVSRRKLAKTPEAASAPIVPKRRNGLSREKILTVATKLFAARGYAAISIRDIAGECGIGIPSIYHFFGDKDSLYVSCCQQLFGEVEATLCSSFKEGASSHAHVRDYAIALCKAMLQNHGFRRLSQMEVLQDEHRSLEEITAPHFLSPFKLLVKAIAALEGEGCATERALLVVSLVYGQIQLQRIAQMVGSDATHGGNPEKLAEYVLNAAMPGHNWTM